jgi:hypothetical protein
MVFQTYKDLEIYRLSHELVIEIHIHNFIKAVESGHKS